jgi:hypothetical protein
VESSFNRSNVVRFRRRDRQALVIVGLADGSRAYVRVDPHTAALGGEHLMAVLRERQVSGEIPQGAIAEVTRTR